VKWSCGFEGSRNWFLYFEGAKRLKGGIAAGMRLTERVQGELLNTQTDGRSRVVVIVDPDRNQSEERALRSTTDPSSLD